jgi:WD40 repeat protein
LQSVSQDRDEVLACGGRGRIVTAAAFSPDGSRLVTGCWDGAVRLWDATTGAELLMLKGHAGAVNGAAFSPDGERIVTAGADGMVLVWNPLGRLTSPGYSQPARGERSRQFVPSGNGSLGPSYRGARRPPYPPTDRPTLVTGTRNGGY